MGIEVNGKVYETDEEGYLTNIQEWEPGVAEIMSKEDDLELTDDHWSIIKFLREYYEEYQIAPAVRVSDQGGRQEDGQGQGQQQVPLRPVPLRSGQAGLPLRRSAEADGLRLIRRLCRYRAVRAPPRFYARGDRGSGGASPRFRAERPQGKAGSVRC